MSDSQCELLTLDLEKIDRMKTEFNEAFDFLFESGFKRLSRCLKSKLAAIKYCKNFVREDNNGLIYRTQKSIVNGKTLANKHFKDVRKLLFK